MPFAASGAARLGVGGRLVAGLVAAACLAVLVVAASITPAPEGHGSHSQLGLPPCGWAVVLDRPCPTCGMTTAYAHAVRGQFPGAFRAQPFGLLLALGTGAAFWAGLYISATRSQLGRVFGRMVTGKVLWCIAALAAAAWAWKWATWTGF
ncbi:MAG: DUF2752 domain-containing protein [Phycisphaerales bacterium]